MTQAHKITIILFMLVFFCGCAPVVQDAPALERPSATATTLPTSTATPTVTMTLTPTATFTPTLTPTLTPTPLGGGSGRLLFQGVKNIGTDDFSSSIYLYDFESQSASMLFDGFRLEDISADGSHLLIAQLGYSTGLGFDDLYLAKLDGSEFTLLSSAFETGALDQLNAGWLIDSSLLIFKERIEGVIQLFSLHPGGEKTQITNSAVGVLSFNPVIVNNGIFWEEGRQDRSGSWSYGWRWVDLSTFETENVAGSGEPLVSPDGQSIAFIDSLDPSMILSDINETNQIQILLEEIITDFQPEHHYYIDQVAWSPDSKNLYLFIGVCAPDCGLERIIILSEDGDHLNEFEVGGFVLYGQPQWSPDGRQMLVVCEWPGFCFLDVETMQISEIEGLQPEDVERIFKIQWLP